MLQKTSITVLIMVLIISCSGRSGDKIPERKPLAVTAVVADSLFTSFPGTLQVNSKHLLLHCPFDGKEKFLMIYDRESGEQITRVGTIGQGPGEWTAPGLANVIEDKLVVFDLNLKNYLLVDADNLYQDISVYDSVRKMDVINPSKFIYLDNNRYIVGNFIEQHPFVMVSNERSTACGKYPFNENMVNYDRFQGNIMMHPQKKILIYGTFFNPYLAMYNIGDDSMDLMWENQFKSPDYMISDHTLQWGSNQPDGVFDIAFTKDYIVCLVKDFKNEATGRDVRTAPKAVYLFDYKGRLAYIFDLPNHTSRLAADAQSNTFYAVSLEPDYRIVKYDLTTVGL